MCIRDGADGDTEKAVGVFNRPFCTACVLIHLRMNASAAQGRNTFTKS